MKFLRSPAFWVVMALIIIIATATAGILFLSSDALRGRVVSFFEKSIELWNETEEKTPDRAIEEARKWTDPQVSAAVHRFLFQVADSRDARRDLRVLESLGPRVNPPILRILTDTSMRARLLAPIGKPSRPETPFNRACDLIGVTAPAEAAGVVSSFLDGPSEQIRKDAALVLGAIGTLEVVEPLRKALRHPDPDVRWWGLMGLQRAIKNRRLSDQCGRALYDDIAHLVVEGTSRGEGAAILLHIDQERGIEFLVSDKVFNPTAPSVSEGLSALRDARIAVRRERLRTLIAQLEKEEMKYPKHTALGEALHLLGRHKQPEDRAFLERWMESSETRAAEGASAGLLAWSDLEDVDDRTWEAESKHGFSKLRPEQQHYIAVLDCDGLVGNGGWSHYFSSRTANDWPVAVAGFQAMGSVERLAILREALAKFGKAGPSRNADRREDELAKLEEKNENVFDELETRFYDSKEVIDVLTTRYVLKNVEAFR